MIVYRPHSAQIGAALRRTEPIVLICEPDDNYLRLALASVPGRPQVDTIDASGCWESLESGEKARWKEIPPANPNLLNFIKVQMVSEQQRRSSGSILWLRNTADSLNNAEFAATLKRFANQIQAGNSSWRILVSGAEISMPREFETLIVSLALSRPVRGGVSKGLETSPQEGVALEDYLKDVVRAKAPEVKISTDHLEKIAARLQGLSAPWAYRVLDRALYSRPTDLLRAVNEERKAVTPEGALKVCDVEGRAAMALGGLHVFRHFIETTRRLRQRAQEEPGNRERIDAVCPTAVILVGVPGCGKSLAVQYASAVLGLPLLQLQMGEVMERWQGASETNLRMALDTATAAAPCVLWIDEIEKALGGLDSDSGGGTGQRILAKLLDWLEKKRNFVFVMATANAVDRLPNELLRPGRFDKKYWVGLPAPPERKEILRKELAFFSKATWKESDLASVAASLMDKFSGADIADVVKVAVRKKLAGSGGTKVSPEEVKDILKTFTPHAKQFAQVAKLEALLEGMHFEPASTAGGEELAPEASVPSAAIQPEIAGLRDAFEKSKMLTLLVSKDSRKYRLEFVREEGEAIASFRPEGSHWDGGRVYNVEFESDHVQLALTDGPAIAGFDPPDALTLKYRDGKWRVGGFAAVAQAAEPAPAVVPLSTQAAPRTNRSFFDASPPPGRAPANVPNYIVLAYDQYGYNFELSIHGGRDPNRALLTIATTNGGTLVGQVESSNIDLKFATRDSVSDIIWTIKEFKATGAGRPTFCPKQLVVIRSEGVWRVVPDGKGVQGTGTVAVLRKA